LHPHGIANARVLYPSEFGVSDLTGVVVAECLPQCGWPQQTADMISAKGRAAIAPGGQHCSLTNGNMPHRTTD
jgi:hypothetical protein